MSCILSREAHPPQIYKERCLNSNCNLSDPAASKCRSISVPRWSRVWAFVYVGGVHLISCYHPEIYQWPLLLVLWQNSGLHQSFNRIKTRVRRRRSRSANYLPTLIVFASSSSNGPNERNKSITKDITISTSMRGNRIWHWWVDGMGLLEKERGTWPQPRKSWWGTTGIIMGSLNWLWWFALQYFTPNDMSFVVDLNFSCRDGNIQEKAPNLK